MSLFQAIVDSISNPQHAGSNSDLQGLLNLAQLIPGVQDTEQHVKPILDVLGPHLQDVLNNQQVDEAYLFPAPGGEPLWRVPDDLAIFVPALYPSKKCCSRRLPRITQRDASTLGSRFVWIHPVELQAAGSFPGAACCNTFRPGS